MKQRRPTLRSGAVLHASPIHCAGQGACASSLQHSALSPRFKRSSGKQQSSPGRKEFHSAAPLFPASKKKPCDPRAVRYRATRATCLLLSGPLAVQRQLLAANAESAHLQVPCSLPENSRSYQHLMGERLSAPAGDLGRPSVREVLKRPDGRSFRTPVPWRTAGHQ